MKIITKTPIITFCCGHFGHFKNGVCILFSDRPAKVGLSKKVQIQTPSIFCIKIYPFFVQL